MSLPATIQNVETESIEKIQETNPLYEIEKDWIKKEAKDYCFIVIGPPRVGKSELIKSMTGCDDLKTSPGVDSCTKGVKEVSVEVEYTDNDKKQITKKVIFYDTPGIETCWNFNDTVDGFVKDKFLVSCMICLTAGCFADSKKLYNLIQILSKSKTYIQLVVTNMYTGSQEQFEEVVKFYENVALKCLWHEKTSKVQNRNIIKTYTEGMIISINSKDFVDYEDKTIPKKNVDEMIGIMFESIDKEKITGIFLSILNNRSFFQKAKHKIMGWIGDDMYPFLKNVAESAYYNGKRLLFDYITDYFAPEQ